MTKEKLRMEIHEAVDQIDDLRVLKMILAIADEYLVKKELTAKQKKKKVKP